MNRDTSQGLRFTSIGRFAVLFGMVAFGVTTCVDASADGDGQVTISGELKQWHKVTLSLAGPFAKETDTNPNPFTDYRMTVRFAHESGTPVYEVPGYFAADGDAANSHATEGNCWRAHLSPDKAGQWTYQVSLVRGHHAAVESSGVAVDPFDGKAGTFRVTETDKSGRDFRGQGRLQYVGEHYLRFAGSGEYFLKAGPDAPETLLAYADFDATETKKKNVPIKTWGPHVKDWNNGDPTWSDGKGKGLIGAINYIAAKGCNTVSFLPYNAGGDGDNVWPFVARDEKLHYDCSKLDQWQIVFDHAQSQGVHLHFKMQETENDDDRLGHNAEKKEKKESLDGGQLGVQRKLYCRELVARFGYELALNWNLGEENTQSPDEQRAMAAYIQQLDPYDHNLVVHTFPDEQEKRYSKLLGDQSVMTGASLQNSWDQAHQRTLQWVTESRRAGRPWVVANDEQGPASHGVPADPGYEGQDGVVVQDNGKRYDLHDIRKATLWGTLTAGGAGVEYYFGYKTPQNDLICEDFRSRERSWDYCRIALEFFHRQIPFWQMRNADELVGNAANDNRRYCFAQAGAIYLVYLPSGGTTTLDLTGAKGQFEVRWFNPRTGGELQTGSVASVNGGASVELGTAPSEPDQDWAVLIISAGTR